jgi:cytochrome P450
MSPDASVPFIDYDQHGRDYAERGVAVEADLRARCPVGWSQHYGGFWALSTHQAVTSVLRDRSLCSSAKRVDADGNTTGGVGIPAVGGYRMVPDETDPPEWDEFRRLLNKPFAPAAVALLRPRIEAFTAEMINRVITSGTADFLMDVANPVTALTTLDMMGLPLGDWRFYAEPIHRIAYESGHPEVQQGIASVYQRLGEIVAGSRPYQPGGLVHDLISARSSNGLLTDENLADILLQLLTGGFDTTASLLAGAVAYLEHSEADRDQLIHGDDTFMRTATEEFVRWISPVISLARTANRDVVVEGSRIRAGDRLWLMYRSANRDTGVFDDPDHVDLSRFPNRHLGFGSGIHRCLGSHLARLVFQIVIRQSLIRLREYAIDYGRAQRLPDLSRVNGWITMPITFRPGELIETGLTATSDTW